MITPFQPGCPWFDLHLNYPPNVEWCEEKLCSWVLTPFNAWTNLAYVALGVYAWAKMKDSKSAAFRFFGPAAMIVGITSLIWHSSLNFFTQIFDFFGMYAFCILLVMFNLARSQRWPAPPKAFRWFWLGVTALTGITVGASLLNPHFPIQIFVFILILMIVTTELKLKLKPGQNRKWFWATFFTLIAAVIFSALDATRKLCDPENHWFQGHGMWHLLSGLALYFAFLHERQFEDELF